MRNGASRNLDHNLEIPDRRFAPSGMTVRGPDRFVASAPLRKRFAFVAGNDILQTWLYAPQRDAPEL